MHVRSWLGHCLFKSTLAKVSTSIKNFIGVNHGDYFKHKHSSKQFCSRGLDDMKSIKPFVIRCGVSRVDPRGHDNYTPKVGIAMTISIFNITDR